MALDSIDALNQNPLLSPFQHSFITSLASVIQSTPAAGLDRERAKAEVAGKRVPTIHISLPHRTNLGQRLEIFIEPEAMVFSYDYDHMHFGYGEPNPSVEEALDFTRDLL
jgi:hypothetical protein